MIRLIEKGIRALNNMKQDRAFYLLNIALPLAFGGIFYLLLCPGTYLSHMAHIFLDIPVILPSSNSALLAFLQNFLCDILWAYALTVAVSWVMGQSAARSVAALGICWALEIGIEWMQKMQVISGTFDPMDIFLECITTIAALLLVKRHRKHTKRRPT